MKGSTGNNLKRSGERNKFKEDFLIFRALSSTNKHLTRRELSSVTDLEISTLCRALFNLVYKRKTVIVAKYDLCKTTGKRVMHFALPKKGGA